MGFAGLLGLNEPLRSNVESPHVDAVARRAALALQHKTAAAVAWDQSAIVRLGPDRRRALYETSVVSNGLRLGGWGTFDS